MFLTVVSKRVLLLLCSSTFGCSHHLKSRRTANKTSFSSSLTSRQRRPETRHERRCLSFPVINILLAYMFGSLPSPCPPFAPPWEKCSVCVQADGFLGPDCCLQPRPRVLLAVRVHSGTVRYHTKKQLRTRRSISSAVLACSHGLSNNNP